MVRLTEHIKYRTAQRGITIEHAMQQIDFTQGGYIIPAFIAALDAYSTKITGYSAARVGQPLSDFDFEHYSFV